MSVHLMPFQDEPFNGDTFICEEFLKLKEQFNITCAVETGSCLYSTTKWLGENFDQVYTVEIFEDFAKIGEHKVADMPNVHRAIGDSIHWLPVLSNKLENESCIFFLDAHWGNVCPLKDELKAIANLNLSVPPVIAIHDFYTGDPELGWDEYNGQPFTIAWIQDMIDLLNTNYKEEYQHFFNTEAKGAKRGIIYIHPNV